MINLTRINRVPLVLNSDLIEYIEKTPDTVVSLTNGLKLLVLESPEEIIGRIIEFRRCVLSDIAEALSNADANPLSDLSASLPRVVQIPFRANKG
jgi:flagellar protein FlbD